VDTEVVDQEVSCDRSSEGRIARSRCEPIAALYAKASSDAQLPPQRDLMTGAEGMAVKGRIRPMAPHPRMPRIPPIAEVGRVPRCYYDKDIADVFRRRDRVVLKVHGTIDASDLIIFTRSQYALARRDYGHFYQLLRGLFVTHTFVFLGTSMRDPDMQLLLEDHAYRFEGSRPHYMAMPYDSARAGTLRVMEDTMNLKALLYDPANNHKSLADSIAALVPKVEAAREEIAATAAW
jgi:hypothetical protein